jgi:rRNA maturation endonuclease Nob1
MADDENAEPKKGNDGEIKPREAFCHRCREYRPIDEHGKCKDCGAQLAEDHDES